jgi:hypothetical protein
VSSVFVAGQHIGGNDETTQAHKSGKLAASACECTKHVSRVQRPVFRYVTEAQKLSTITVAKRDELNCLVVVKVVACCSK